jgi:hypothetical protein
MTYHDELRLRLEELKEFSSELLTNTEQATSLNIIYPDILAYVFEVNGLINDLERNVLR